MADRQVAKDLQNKVILLTGATGGLGGATAIELGMRGATVVLLGRKVRQLERVYDAVVKTGAEPVIYPLDLEGASPDDYFEMAQTVQEQLGRLDAVVHCAANFEGLTPFHQMDPAKLARALHVNFTSMAWLTQAVEPVLLSTANETGDPGKVVVVLDDANRIFRAFWGGYGVAQQARRQFVTMHANELGADARVRIIGFEPGAMRTMLRSRAYADDVNPNLRNPSEVAPLLCQVVAATDCVQGQIIGEPGRVAA